MLFHITEHCSLGCPHCFISSVPDGRHADFKVVERFVKFVKEMGAYNIVISGGEPTEHPNFFEYMDYICRYLDDRIIVLVTNGRFMTNAEDSMAMIGLQKKYKFSIQISACQVHPKQENTIHLYNQLQHLFLPNHVFLIDEILHIKNLGRAKGKDWSQYNKYRPLGTMCFNYLSVSRQSRSFSEAIGIIETNLIYCFCKPLIDYQGILHPGESIFCQSLGSIFDSDKEILDKFKNAELCGLCLEELK